MSAPYEECLRKTIFLTTLKVIKKHCTGQYLLDPDDFFLVKSVITQTCKLVKKSSTPERFGDPSFVQGYNPGCTTKYFLIPEELKEKYFEDFEFFEKESPDRIIVKGLEASIFESDF